MIDTNVLLDVILHRKKFFRDSYRVLELCETGEIEGYVSASTITDIYFIVEHQTSPKRAYEAVGEVLNIMKVSEVTSDDVKRAYQRRPEDFEDGLLYECARKQGCSMIITRNYRDFLEFGFPVLTPWKYLKDRENESERRNR